MNAPWLPAALPSHLLREDSSVAEVEKVWKDAGLMADWQYAKDVHMKACYLHVRNRTALKRLVDRLNADRLAYDGIPGGTCPKARVLSEIEYGKASANVENVSNPRPTGRCLPIPVSCTSTGRPEAR